MNVKQTRYHTDAESLFRCSVYRSDDIRIAAVVDCTVRPNDSQDPVEDFAMLAAYATWEKQSDAWCDAYQWQGIAAALEEFSK